MKIKDYGVSGEVFEIAYNEKYDCYQTIGIPQNIAPYYQSDAYLSHTDGKKTFFEKIYQWVKKYNLNSKIRLMERFSAKKGKLLDIGAGTADFLVSAKQNGWEITGVEPSELARYNAQQKGVYLLKNQEEIKGKYDVISLWHVLEHIENTRQEMAFLADHLTDNGLILIAVPNYKSKDATIYGEYWAAYDVPRHIHHFSQKSITLLSKEVGFEVVCVKPMWFDAFYVSILSEKYKGHSFAFLRGLLMGLYSNICGIKTGEFSSLIYLLKKEK